MDNSPIDTSSEEARADAAEAQARRDETTLLAENERLRERLNDAEHALYQATEEFEHELAKAKAKA